MFQYTSETIINSNEGSLKLVNGATGVRFAAVNANGQAATKASNDAEMIIIDGVTSLAVSDICKVYHTTYMKPELAKAELDLSTVVDATNEGKVLRLRIYLTESGRSSAMIKNAYLRCQRPFVYEMELKNVSGNEAALCTKLAKMINTEMAEYDIDFITASATTTTLTFTAGDCYIRFAKANGIIASVGDKPIECGFVTNDPNSYLGEKFDVVAGGEVKVVGNEGAGTVAQMIKDLRIPTSASTDPFHGDHGGMPVPGGKYDQYVFEVLTDRRHISGGVVGEVGKSLTTFVFFVESAAVTAFEKMLDDAKITTVGAGMPTTGGVASVREQNDTRANGETEVVIDAKGVATLNKRVD